MTLKNRVEQLEAESEAPKVDSLEVLVRRPISEMTDSGPAYSGDTIITHFVDGELVERREESGEPDG